MVNFHDPAVIAKDFLAVKTLYLVSDGIFLWEFITTLDYELNIIRRKRPYRWTIWIYSITRMVTLLAVILDLVFFNTTTRINCQAWATLQIMSAYLSTSFATLLIIFRIIAIWNRTKIIRAIAGSLWLTNVGVSVWSVSQVRSVWDPAEQLCAVLNMESSKPLIVVDVTIDIVLLLIALVGLFHLRNDGGGRIGVGQFLWKQGVLWLLIALLAELPPAVFIVLNLNDPWNMMFQLPSGIAVSIASTRMYRTLTDFISGVTRSGLESDKSNSNKGSGSHVKRNSFNPIEVTVDMSYEQHQMLRIGHHDPCTSTELGLEEQKCEKPHTYELRQTFGETV